MRGVWRAFFGLSELESGLCSRKELNEGNLGSSETDPLAGAPSLDGPSLTRGFPVDVGVPPVPSASPSALAARRSFDLLPPPSASPSARAVRRFRVPLPLPRAFPVGPPLPRNFLEAPQQQMVQHPSSED